MTEFASQLPDYRLLTLAPDDYEVLYQLGIVLRREADIWGAIVDCRSYKMEKRITFYNLLMLKLIKCHLKLLSKLAACAYANEPVWKIKLEKSHFTKHQKFLESWLTQAVPAAWEAVREEKEFVNL